ncbi:hypothetical protein PR202_ga21515 [Eleusine coracana subsp. coracana]|uniref:PGG domain-containing protein n=1 Tax=Eleusine coracana subsp. coracana TaxID=191504 RepID=A0AAV5D179_ELECO|nr:hypothetical protein PR202_ga21515 [Eleusine coracana subsp. coracana]
MMLVIDVGNGRTIEIPLKGHLTLRNCGSHSQDAAGEALMTGDGEQVSGGGSAPGQAPAFGFGEESCGAEQVTANSGDAEAKKYLNDMRGWLMTVATLFVGISFQALSQKPSWMPEPKLGWNLWNLLYGNHTDPAQREAAQVALYVLGNTIAFSFSLLLMVMLLLPDMISAKRTMMQMTVIMILLSILFAVNFVAMFKDVHMKKFALTIVLSAILVPFISLLLFKWWLVVGFATTTAASFCTRLTVTSDQIMRRKDGNDGPGLISGMAQSSLDRRRDIDLLGLALHGEGKVSCGLPARFGDVLSPNRSGDKKGEPGKDALLPADGVKLNSSFSLNKVYSLFSSFRGDKKDLLESIGFGGLISMHKQSKMSIWMDYGVRMNTKEKNAFKVASVLFVDSMLLARNNVSGKVNHSIMSLLADPS